MNKSGEIILIEDDEDDQMLFKETAAGLHIKNDVVAFFEAPAALEYLSRPDVDPFLIVCDINLPGLSGVELREIVKSDLQMKAKNTPFIFFTTGANRLTIERANVEHDQGVFIKPTSYTDLQLLIRTMVDYWSITYAGS